MDIGIATMLKVENDDGLSTSFYRVGDVVRICCRELDIKYKTRIGKIIDIDIYNEHILLDCSDKYNSSICGCYLDEVETIEKIELR